MSSDFIIGDTFGYAGPVKDVALLPFNLTGYTITSEMWSAPDTWGVDTKLSDMTTVVLDAVNGLVAVRALPVVTGTWLPGGARLKFIMVSASGVRTSAYSNKFNLRV